MERTRMNGESVAVRRRRRWSLAHWLGAWGAAAGLSSLLLGCSLDSLLKNDELPQDVTDPAITKTRAGALNVYRGTIVQLQIAFGGYGHSSSPLDTSNFTTKVSSFVPVTALFTDEFDQPSGSGVTSSDPVNQRALAGTASNTDVNNVYAGLNRVRGQAGQAIQLLAQYAPDQPALAGHMYAIEAYAEIMLAELFCSGIPLSTIDYNGDYTYRPGSTTDQVFTHALALLDTGLTLAADSARYVNLIRVAQGRARLALGQYTEAATAVAAVPDDYGYAVSYTSTTAHEVDRSFAYMWSVGISSPSYWSSVGDREGDNGLDYVTSGDPRTASTLLNGTGADGYQADKYASDGSTPIVLASGVEARLIQAEAALQASDAPGWLTALNALRTDGTYDTTETSPPDTLWHAGIGGVAGLAPLADPGTDSGRVDLMFRERAFWLFLTGHRQGDLRRLIRQYDRTEDAVYPTGTYPVGGNLYGTDVVAPIPMDEKIANPLFTGCASTGA